jgi:murein DD-endopeptidase MepM/ murein hydrolase activator NlpD
MRTDIKKILESFDNILNENKSLVNEAAFESPVDNTSVNSPFGPRWGRQHTGVDLAANAANVKSPADGVVEIAAIKNDDCGGTITINHADGFKTGYCHMQKISVQPGQRVAQGDVIGISGGGAGDVGRGRSDGRHLHFTLRKNGQLVNPMDYIDKEGINLTGPVPTSTTSGSTSGASEDAYNYANSSQSSQSTQSSRPQYAAVVGDVKSSQGLTEKKNIENMNKDNNIQKILELYQLMLNTSHLNEVSSSSDELLGGGNVKIPVDGAHAGQSGWQSSNAWDIKGNVGAPVYALADGVAQTFSDYGRSVTKTQGKKLYGQSFTVKSDNGLPSIYYTHLEGSPVSKGSKIECGQFLGYIMDFPDSSYDHVHIGVESGNIRQFLNDDGTIKCAKGQKISGTEIGDSPSSDFSNDSSSASEEAYNFATSGQSTKPSRPKYAEVVGDVKSAKGLYEQRNFGKNVSNRYGRVIIPKDDNPKIKAPISGKINNSKYFSSCANQVTIENNDNGTVYLQFCGISSPRVRNNQSVSPGDVLGNTDTDVEVLMYDGRWNRINIPEKDLKITKSEKESDVEEKKKKSSEPEYYDPLMAAILGAPSKLFQDKYDKEGNRTEKRFGGVADKKEVDPWVLNFLKDPFKRKKVNENIEKIKKLL